jgi:hypothetical protein
MAHDPSLAAKRQQARSRGGRGKSKRARAERLLPDDLVVLDRVIDSAISGVYRGALTPGQGSALSALVGSKVRLRNLALRIQEQIELVACHP